MSTEEGVDIKYSLDCNGEFLCRFEDTLKNSTCFMTDDSKREGKSFTGYALLHIKQEANEKQRTLNIASIFIAGGLAIAEMNPAGLYSSDCKSWIQVFGSTPKLTLHHTLHGI